MGLFQKPKTSLDYLKDISAAQKKQANVAKKQVEAEKYAAERQAEDIIDAEKERTKRALQLAEQQERQDLVRTLRSLSFATNDENEIEHNLEYLVPMIDGWMQSFKSARKEDFLCKLAETKFSTGLRRLQVLNPSYPMLSYYEEKQKEYECKREKYRKQFKQRLLGVIMTPIIVILLFLFLFNGENDGMGMDVGAFMGAIYGCGAAIGVYFILIGKRGTERGTKNDE